MNDFTASNGVRITIDGEGDYRFRGGEKEFCVPSGGANEEALREMFRVEDDEHLDRWRWPENPAYVVYPLDEHGQTVVLHEKTGHNITFFRDRVNSGGSEYAQCARAFFADHPETQPWHEAEIGDVWVMGTLDVAYTVVGGVDSGRWFTRSDVFGKVETRDLTDPSFSIGTRIWSGKNR